MTEVIDGLEQGHHIDPHLIALPARQVEQPKHFHHVQGAVALADDVAVAALLAIGALDMGDHLNAGHGLPRHGIGRIRDLHRRQSTQQFPLVLPAQGYILPGQPARFRKGLHHPAVHRTVLPDIQRGEVETEYLNPADQPVEHIHEESVMLVDDDLTDAPQRSQYLFR